MMKSSYFSIWFALIALFSVIELGIGVDCNANKRGFISWNDLKLEQSPKLHRRKGSGNNGVIVVDKNGGGDCLTVQAAVDMVPKHNTRRVKILILPGVYSEKVFVPKSKPYITFVGDENRPEATVIAWHDKASDRGVDGLDLGTYKTATVAVESDYFCAVGITFENTVNFRAGDKGNQAVAFRIAGDKAMFYKSRFLGFQDTLLDDVGTHLYLECFIQGSIDFIFGRARSLYKKCIISVVGNSYAIAAQRRDSARDNGIFSFVNCTVHGTGHVYLGRAWGDYSRIVYAYTEFDIDVKPQGWDDFGKENRQNTVLFGEYECRGRGANRRGRVPWSKSLTRYEAKPYLDYSSVINGKQWLRL